MGVEQITIESGWLTAAVETKLQGSNGFLRFQDATLQCVLLWAKRVTMQVVRRTKKEEFSATVEAAVKVRPKMRLVVNGNFYRTPYAAYIGDLADPDIELFGDLYDRSSGTIEKWPDLAEGKGAAYLAQEDKTSPIQMDFGDPPSTCWTGMGSLIPLVIHNTPVDDSNRRYKGSKAYGDSPTCGRVVVAKSGDGKFLLVAVQQNGAKPGFTQDQFRDKLAGADMSDAVFLDGSDSAMMYFDRTPIVRQGDAKNRSCRVGLGFYYYGDEAGVSPPDNVRVA